MKSCKKLFSLLLALAIMFSLAVPCFAAGSRFADAEGHWAERVINELAEDGVIIGYDDGLCYPDFVITRSQFTALVDRYFSPKLKTNNTTNTFTDIESHWAKDNITRLVNAGIIVPAEYGRQFKPDSYITRIEMIRMMVRVLGLEKNAESANGDTEFTDNNIAGADKGYVRVAREWSLIEGYPDGSVRPYQYATRAEGFTILKRLIAAYDKKQAEDEANKPSTPSGGGGFIPAPAPVPEISFTLPETAYVGEAVEVSAASKNAQSVAWTVSRDNAEPSVTALGKGGGTLRFAESGSYVLTAIAANRDGKTVSFTQTITVYPVVGLSFELAESAYVDQSCVVSGMVENQGEAKVEWTIERDGAVIDDPDIVSHNLNDIDGTIQFHEQGEYALTAAVTDALGKISSCTRIITVYPNVKIKLDLPATSHIDESVLLEVTGAYLDDLPAVWTVKKDGVQVSPDTDETIMGIFSAGQSVQFTVPGTYTVTVTVTDELGTEYSSTDNVTVYPIGEVGFFLPTVFHIDDIVTVEAMVNELADNELVWSLVRNGEEVALDDYVVGELTKDGGDIQVIKKGEYVLTASFVDGGGREYSFQQSFKAYPVPPVNFTIPATAWTDRQISVDLDAEDIEEVTIEWLVDNTYGYQDWETFVDGSLDNSGGTIRFKRAGTYEIVARITDELGRMFLYEVGAVCEVQPALSIQFELPEYVMTGEMVNIRTSGNNNVLPVAWYATVDGTNVALEDCVSGQLNNRGGAVKFLVPGEYVVTAAMTDVLGRTFTHSESIMVYPVVDLALTLPETTHVGEPVELGVSGSYFDGRTITWSVLKDGNNIANEDGGFEYILGTLANGENLVFTKAGVYTLTAEVLDDLGAKCSANVSITVYPVGRVGFTLPEKFHTDETVRVETNMSNLDGNALVWSLKHNGTDVALDTCISGELTEDGGEIQVVRKGEYVLTAAFTDGSGRAYEYQQSFTVYPVPSVSITGAGNGWTDTVFGIAATANNLDGLELEWVMTGEDDTAGVSPSIYADCTLDNNGGTIQFKGAGRYSLCAKTTDGAGRTFSFEAGSFDILPLLDMRFELPKTTVAGDDVVINVPLASNAYETVWTIVKDNNVVADISAVMDGDLSVHGGTVQFTDHGKYTITAAQTDRLGRTFENSEDIEVYPVCELSLTLPEATHTDEAVRLGVIGKDIDGLAIDWTVTRDGEEVSPTSGIVQGTLAHNHMLTFTKAGVYVLTASVTDGLGIEYSAEKTITVYPIIDVSFDIPDEAYENAEFDINGIIRNQGDAEISWTVEKNGVAVGTDKVAMDMSGINGTAQCSETGTYVFIVTVTDKLGREWTCSDSIKIHPVPNMALKLSETKTHTDETVRVTLSGGNFTEAQVIWIVTKDGIRVEPATVINGRLSNGAEIMFTQAGEYTLSASYADGLGVEYNAERSITVYPVIDVSFSIPDEAYVNAEFDINGIIRNQGDAEISWTVEKNGIAADDSVTMSVSGVNGVAQCSEIGAYVFTVTVTDKLGREWTCSDNIQISAEPSMSVSLSKAATHTDEPVSVTLTGRNINANAIVWTVTKDGIRVNPTAVINGHLTDGAEVIFMQSGSYTLTALYVDEFGIEYAAETSIDVYPTISLQFDIPSNAYVGASFVIQGRIENQGGASISWNVKKDGAEVSDKVVMNMSGMDGIAHCAEPGTYVFTATATDELGRKWTYSDSISIYAEPRMTLSMDKETVHTDEAVHLSLAGSNYNPASMVWSVTKDGVRVDPATVINGLLENGSSILFTQAGTYTLTAAATDDFGRAVEASDRITVYPVGEVGFFLPTAFHTDETVQVKANIHHLDGHELIWTLVSREGHENSAVALETVLDETGGALRVSEKGLYTLSASFVDDSGREYTYAQNFTVYPVPELTFSFPAVTWAGTSINVTCDSRDLDGSRVEWLVDNTYGYQDWNTFVDGTLGADGGSIAFKHPGRYELDARVIDATGRVFVFENAATCDVLPVLEIDFAIPERFGTGESVDVRTSGDNNSLPIEWSLTKDGVAASIAEHITGNLNNTGGRISFRTHGSYTLTATMTDAEGRKFTASKTFTVYALPIVSLATPELWHIGETFPVELSGEYMTGCSVTWDVRKDGVAATYTGTLGTNGGNIALSACGTYSITATVQDADGNEVSASARVKITNTAPQMPTVTVFVDYTDGINGYTENGKVKANITVEGGSDTDGDTIHYEYATGSAKDGYFGLGTHTVKVRSVDQWGMASSWVTKSFTITSEAPTVALTSPTLGSSSSTTSSTVAFNAAVTSSTRYQLSSLDYYNRSNASYSEAGIAANTNASFSGSYSSGRHLMVVQAKDWFGQAAYDSKFFIIGSATAGGGASVTSMTTTAAEAGIYDGSTPLAYIASFEVNLPAISGHGGTDNFYVRGQTADGRTEEILHFTTGNGYCYANSNGTYKSSTQSNGTWSGWDANKYTKLTFQYTMASGHESCLASATSGLSYTVSYNFIEGGASDLGNLFS